MSSRWESIVTTAREIDGAYADGIHPESAMVMQLARAVLDFQQHLSGIRPIIKARLAPGVSADAVGE